MSGKKALRCMGNMFLLMVFALSSLACGGGSGVAEGAEADGGTAIDAITEQRATATRGSEGSTAARTTAQRTDATTQITPPSTPRPEASVVRTIPAGTALTFRVTETLSTSSHEEGDRFTLRLTSSAAGSKGAELPAGTLARGVVTQSRPGRNSDEEAVLALALESVQLNGRDERFQGVVESMDVRADAGDSGTRRALKVATGTAAGAMVGRILGGDTGGAVRGAVVGTVAGAGIALSTRNGHATLPEGSLVTVRLAEPLVMP